MFRAAGQSRVSYCPVLHHPEMLCSPCPGFRSPRWTLLVLQAGPAGKLDHCLG